MVPLRALLLALLLSLPFLALAPSAAASDGDAATPAPPAVCRQLRDTDYGPLKRVGVRAGPLDVQGDEAALKIVALLCA